MTPRRRGMGRVAMALGVVAIVVVAAVAVLSVTGANNPRAPQSSTTSSTSSGTGTESTNASLAAYLTAECKAQNSNPATVVEATTDTAAVICLQYYYYNTTAPLTLNLTGGPAIQALQYIQNGSESYPRTFNGASNFTVMASQNQLVIGGPSSENEGVTVAFAIVAKAGASGTYQLSFPGVCSGCSTSWDLLCGRESVG